LLAIYERFIEAFESNEACESTEAFCGAIRGENSLI
jgi:hypothetical protein